MMVGDKQAIADHEARDLGLTIVEDDPSDRLRGAAAEIEEGDANEIDGAAPDGFGGGGRLACATPARRTAIKISLGANAAGGGLGLFVSHFIFRHEALNEALGVLLGRKRIAALNAGERRMD